MRNGRIKDVPESKCSKRDVERKKIGNRGEIMFKGQERRREEGKKNPANWWKLDGDYT